MAELIETSQPLVDGMKEAYETGATANIEEGYGASIEEDFANAALSQQVATVNEFNSTTQNEIVSALSQASALDSEDGDIDILFKTYLSKNV